MARVFNFSAGPSALPLAVLEKAAADMTDYQGSGMSVMEMSHRSKVYGSIIDGAEAGLRKLMNIPENYKVLFLQGGASAQFAMIPLNLMKGDGTANYVNTGAWSKKAIAEAKRYGNVNVVASSEDATFNYIPELKNEDIADDAAYFHITSNNTIYGTKFNELPKVDMPIVADMSSCILSEEINVADYGMIYAGAQKNIGPAGVTVVIIREDLLGNEQEVCPTMFNYKVAADNGSMFNTPPTYGIYVAKLVFDWLLEKGGIAAQEKENKAKAELLYGFLDNSTLFSGTARVQDRSLMNVPFVLPTDELNAQFIAEALENKVENLKGHHSVGGMRASIYNGMPLSGVEALVAFMAKFEAANK